MLVLGIDPGASTGWCVYDTQSGRAVWSSTTREAAIPDDLHDHERAAIERPRGYGPTRPQVVDCAWIAGVLSATVAHRTGVQVVPIERKDVRRQLTEATLGVVSVRTDATAWAALCLTHGGDQAGKRGGKLHGVKSHERAALALAYAYARRYGWLDELPF